MTGLAEEPDEGTLLRAVASGGDERAFAMLFDWHTPALSRFVRRVLGQYGQETEDVVQETWIRAVAGLRGFRRESSFRSWLFAIGLNVARRELRLRIRAREYPLEEEAAPPMSEDAAIELERAIARLPDGYRTIFVLHDVHGFTHEQIAAMVGVAPGTSKSQLSRARAALRAILEPTGKG